MCVGSTGRKHKTLGRDAAGADGLGHINMEMWSTLEEAGKRPRNVVMVKKRVSQKPREVKGFNL